MNHFSIIFGRIFKLFKRALGLILSYIGSLGLMLAPIDRLYNSAADSIVLSILLLALSILGLISFIDTIIYQVKSYSGE